MTNAMSGPSRKLQLLTTISIVLSHLTPSYAFSICNSHHITSIPSHHILSPSPASTTYRVSCTARTSSRWCIGSQNIPIRSLSQHHFLPHYLSHSPTYPSESFTAFQTPYLHSNPRFHSHNICQWPAARRPPLAADNSSPAEPSKKPPSRLDSTTTPLLCIFGRITSAAGRIGN